VYNDVFGGKKKLIAIKGLTALPDLDELTAQFRDAGFHKAIVQRLLPGSTFYGILAGRK
jgi:hypothetical protein